MQLSPAQYERLKATLAAKGVLGRCKQCSGKLAVADPYSATIQKNAATGPITVEGTPTMPFGMTVCENCGNTLFYSLQMLGIRD